MKPIRRLAAMLVAVLPLMLGAAPALAAEEPNDPARQTPWGLYLTSTEAYEMKQAQGETVLFIDVRDPIEIMFTGFTDVVDRNIPFLLSDPSQWHANKPVFKMAPNPSFAAEVEAALADAGLDKSAPVILMCRSGGSRGAPSAKALEGLGLEAVYVVVDGFEGGTVKDHPNGPWRLKNGWKNSGLPWSYSLNKEKMYFRSAATN